MLAEWLFFDESLVTKHKVILDKIQWCRSLQGGNKSSFTPAKADTLNPGTLNATGKSASTPHRVYVDDDIYLDITDRRRFKQATAAGIKVIFILLGDSNLACRQDHILWEKLHELLIAPINHILGLVLDPHRMTVGRRNLSQLQQCSFKQHGDRIAIRSR